ncbi:MAG: DUF2927 domain-containing protein [Proteobacteria bacterium]|nr:DUF2927 domain-containing protein [Pseudomonadota bacterium]
MQFISFIKTLLFGLFIGLAACVPLSDTTQQKPIQTGSAHDGPSVKSQQAVTYYASLQARFLAKGYLRQDFDPVDAPFTTDDLVANFTRIAFFEEYSTRNGRRINRRVSSPLRRWEQPIRIGIHFGPSVTKEQRGKDTAYVRKFASRLARLSGLDIQLTKAPNANFSVLFLNVDEQRDYTPKLTSEIKHLSPQIAREIKLSPRSVRCAAYASYIVDEAAQVKGYWSAVIVIKTEHPDLMRKSCIQEEMTQALGLINDSPDARPSIFNDDEEFAFLTRHDELLLRMLYDKRLSVGMTAKAAQPIIQQIAQGMMSAGGS